MDKALEYKLREYFNTAAIGVYQSTWDGRFTMANASLLKLLGYYSSEEFYNTSLEKVALDRSSFRRELLKNGEIKSFETTWTMADGTTVPVIENARLVRRNGNKDTLEWAFIEGTVQEIQQLKAAERALKASEVKYRTVVENSHAGILMLDEFLRFVFINNKVCEILGAPLEEIMGCDFREFVAPQDRDRVVEHYRWQGDKADVYNPFTFSIKRKNGEIRIVESLVTFLKEPLENWRIVAQILDVTRRVHFEEALIASETRYRGLIETMPQGFGIRDEEGRLQYANEQLCQMLQYAKSELIERNLLEIVFPDDQEKFKNELKKRRQGLSTTYELRWTRGDGTALPTIVSSRPIFDTKGKFQGSFAVVTDISRQKTNEKKLRKLAGALRNTNKELKKMVAARNKLLGIAAHDLRNPLSALKVGTQLLLKDREQFTESQYSLLSTIHKSADYMANLVDDLLDYSTIESGRLELKVREHNLTAIINERLTLIKLALRSRNQHLQVHLPKSLTVPVDETRIAQVIDNLLSNALKFSESGGTIYVNAGFKDHMVYFAVRDEGPGIPKKDMNKLFGEFQRLSTKPTKGEKGTGLGLSICKKIVDAHGGNIQVESTVGEGATFTVYLPAP